MASNIDGKYIKVQGWMATQLGLHGNELIVYAYIYSFQFKNFIGKDTSANVEETEIPMRDFVEWTQITKRGIIKLLQKLSDEKLISIGNKPGNVNTYSILPDPVKKALKKEGKGSEQSSPLKKGSEQSSGVNKVHRGSELEFTSGSEQSSPGVVNSEAKSSEQSSPHLQHNYIDNKETTNTTTRAYARGASASLSTDTAPETAKTASQDAVPESDLIPTMTEEEKAQVAALEAMRDGIHHGIRPKWMRSNPMKQFPEAYSFLHKDRPRLSKLEQELVRKYSAWLISGKPEGSKAKEEKIPTKEEVCTLPPPSEIGQEAYDAQKSLLQLVYGKDVTIHTAGEK